jgi:hypothetical protein
MPFTEKSFAFFSSLMAFNIDLFLEVSGNEELPGTPEQHRENLHRKDPPGRINPASFNDRPKDNFCGLFGLHCRHFPIGKSWRHHAGTDQREIKGGTGNPPGFQFRRNTAKPLVECRFRGLISSPSWRRCQQHIDGRNVEIWPCCCSNAGISCSIICTGAS